MVPQKYPCSNQEISKEVRVSLTKRKEPPTEICKPRTKSARIDSSQSDDFDVEFNSYQYWKDPLPDISLELLKLPSRMLCDE